MDTIEKRIVKIGDFIEQKYKVFFVLILLLAIAVNTYKFGEVPSGIDCDEAGMTYDAYSIANYGVDRFENQFPVYFTNFGDGQSIMQGYLVALLIKTFGTYNTFLIRIPSLVLSIIETVVAYLLVKLFKSRKQALLFMLLVTIAPWHIMKSRWALDCYLFSPMLLFSVYMLAKAIKDNKLQMLKFVLAGTMFGLTLYTYAISYIAIPLFLVLILAYLIIKKSIKLKNVIAFSIPLIVFAIPLVLMLMVQKGWIGEIESFITIPKLLRFRENELDLSQVLVNVATIKYGLLCDKLNFNSLPGYGELYYFGTLLMCMGITITLIRSVGKKGKEQIELDVIMLLLFFANLIIGFLTDMCANKINGIYISATYFELVALRFIYKKYKVLFAIILIMFLASFIMFLKAYFIDFAKADKPYWDNGAVALMEYIQKYGEKEIYADNILYIYSIYAKPIPPSEFNKSKEISGSKVVGYKNYHAYLPSEEQEFSDEAIYITDKKDKLEKLIDTKGFSIEQYGNFYIAYKNQ